ncbi:MAG: hypothetical protein AB8E15_02280 [Bdellovibrionales bacterium]
MKWLILFLVLSLNSKAEYRVFELSLTKPNGNQKTIISTLDAYQYSTYNPLDPDQSIEYVDSWICGGNTSGFKNYCEKPERVPANEL